MRFVSLYLAAIVVANLLFSHVLSPGYSETTQLSADFAICVGFIGIDLAIRDKLHETWRNERLLLKMSGLIVAGSALSYLVNYVLNASAPDVVLRVAAASFLAFALSGFVDFGVYQKLSNRPLLSRVNGSNVPSALVDSLVFPFVAFGLPLAWKFVVVEFVAKLLGGFFWSVLLISRGWLTDGRVEFQRDSPALPVR